MGKLEEVQWSVVGHKYAREAKGVAMLNSGKARNAWAETGSTTKI